VNESQRVEEPNGHNNHRNRVGVCRAKKKGSRTKEKREKVNLLQLPVILENLEVFKELEEELAAVEEKMRNP